MKIAAKLQKKNNTNKKNVEFMKNPFTKREQAIIAFGSDFRLSKSSKFVVVCSFTSNEYSWLSFHTIQTIKRRCRNNPSYFNHIVRSNLHSIL